MALNELSQASGPDAGKLRPAFDRVSNAEFKGVMLKTTVVQEIKPVLTPAQIQQLEAKRQDILYHVSEFLKHLDTFLGNL